MRLLIAFAAIVLLATPAAAASPPVATDAAGSIHITVAPHGPADAGLARDLETVALGRAYASGAKVLVRTGPADPATLQKARDGLRTLDGKMTEQPGAKTARALLRAAGQIERQLRKVAGDVQSREWRQLAELHGLLLAQAGKTDDARLRLALAFDISGGGATSLRDDLGPASDFARKVHGGLAARATGSLAVERVPDGTRVFLDGRLVGRAPLEPFALPEGLHVLRLIAEGHERGGEVVRVRAGKTTRARTRLRPMAGERKRQKLEGRLLAAARAGKLPSEADVAALRGVLGVDRLLVATAQRSDGGGARLRGVLAEGEGLLAVSIDADDRAGMRRTVEAALDQLLGVAEGEGAEPSEDPPTLP